MTSLERFSDIDAMRNFCMSARRDAIGLVPTMGALHEGHLSLVRRAKSQTDVCVTTIFVNPTQFAPAEDLNRYPRPLERDLDLLTREGVDAVFLPTPEMMYPAGFGTYVLPAPVARPLEGASRPEHFRGVTTVVMKLLQIIPADASFFGQKDFQQLRVIQQMVTDLNVATKVVSCPIVRESDGLAMSSRNRYLSESERHTALSLSRALRAAQDLFDSGCRESRKLETAMRSELSACDSVDYAVVADPVTLTCQSTIHGDAVALIAARVGNTRLIDNRTLSDHHIPQRN